MVVPLGLPLVCRCATGCGQKPYGRYFPRSAKSTRACIPIASFLARNAGDRGELRVNVLLRDRNGDTRKGNPGIAVPTYLAAASASRNVISSIITSRCAGSPSGNGSVG